jgi:hypothetical protein
MAGCLSMMNHEECGRKQLSILRYYIEICMDGLAETM